VTTAGRRLVVGRSEKRIDVIEQRSGVRHAAELSRVGIVSEFESVVRPIKIKAAILAARAIRGTIRQKNSAAADQVATSGLRRPSLIRCRSSAVACAVRLYVEFDCESDVGRRFWDGLHRIVGRTTVSGEIGLFRATHIRAL
jgi:hypothetical protein